MKLKNLASLPWVIWLQLKGSWLLSLPFVFILLTSLLALYFLKQTEYFSSDIYFWFKLIVYVSENKQ